MTRDPFNPDSGEFAKNIRSLINDDDTDLRQSMRALGWNKHLPAFVDEKGVVIVGHRRMKIAAELGIEPVTLTIDFGQGEAADAERLKLAIASNTGAKPLNKNDRQKLAQYLYGKQEWTMEKIGAALNVDQATISRDLGDLCTVHKSKEQPKTASNPKGSGRRKGSGKAETPKPAAPKPPKDDTPKPEKPKRKPETATLRDTPTLQRARDLVRPLVRDNKPICGEDLAPIHGLSHGIIHTAVHVERALKDEQLIDASTLSASAQEKLDSAIKRHQKKLDAEFNDRINARVQQFLRETTIPHKLAEAKKLVREIERRKGFLSKAEHNRFRFALHPDTYKNVDSDERNRLTQKWEELKAVMVAEKEHPIAHSYDLPPTWEDLEKHAAEVRRQASERAKAAHAKRKGDGVVS